MIFQTILVGLVFFSKYQIVYSLNCYIGNNPNNFFYVKKLADHKNPKGGYTINSLLNSALQPISVNGDITMESSEIAKTFKPIYDDPSRYNFIQYNDILQDNTVGQKPVTGPKSTVSRGAFIWEYETNSALLFQSSVPKFLPPFSLPETRFSNYENTKNTYSFPQSYKKDGHWFICIIFDIEYVETILKHILVRSPTIYGIHINSQASNAFYKALSIFSGDSVVRTKKGWKIKFRLEDDLENFEGDKIKIVTKTSKPNLLKKVFGKSTDNQIIRSKLIIPLGKKSFKKEL